MTPGDPPSPEKTTDIGEGTIADESAAFVEGSSRPPSCAVIKNTALLVYAIFMLHGVGTLMPWNMFLTISPSYFINYKFAPSNETGSTTPDYSKYFFSYLGVCSQLPNLLLNFLNLFIVMKADLARRIIYSLAIVASICVFTMIFIYIDTFSWMTGFFILTMTSVVILNSANGIYQNSIYGLTALFPHNFTNAVIIGNNLSGIFVTLVLILTLLFSKDVQFVACLYFSVALTTILACLFSFLWLPKISFYVHHTSRARNRRTETPEDQRFTLVDFKNILAETWKQMLAVFLTFFVTLSLFPAIVSDIQLYPNNRAYDFFLPQNLYVPVITFLNFNVFATIGNVLANYVQWPRNKDSVLWPTVARLLFIPFFLFCNYGGSKRSAPVYFGSEYAFIVMLILMSFTHGYISSVSLMYAPAHAAEKSRDKAGMMSAFFLVLGVAVGVSFTFLESWLVLG